MLDGNRGKDMGKVLKILFISGLLTASLWADQYTEPIKTDNTITFQGYLTDPSGRPYFGTVWMDFVFYDTEHPSSDITENYKHKLYPIGNDVSSQYVLPRMVAVSNGQYATQLAMPAQVMSALNAADDVWVEVYVARSDSGSGIATTTNMLTPRVQLNAAPYAQAVRGLYYDSSKTALKIGKGFQGSAVNTIDIDLAISGNVGVGTSNAQGARLVIDGEIDDDFLEENHLANMYIEANMLVSGDIHASGGGVWGAVWN
jgi:hypothetical protein